MMRFPRSPQPGDPITAEHIAALYDALEGLEIRVVAPLALDSDGTISLSDVPGFWIKITGAPTGPAHPWKEQQAATGGTFQDRVLVGTTTSDPAYELNGSTATLTGKYVRAWRDKATNEVRFLFASCS